MIGEYDELPRIPRNGRIPGVTRLLGIRDTPESSVTVARRPAEKRPRGV